MINKIAYILLALLSIEVMFLGLDCQKKSTELTELKNYLNSEDKQAETHKLLSIEIANWNSNEKISLYEYINKGDALIFYFSANCSSCDEIAQIWNSIYDKYKEKSTIIGLTFDSYESIFRFINKNAVLFPIYRIINIPEDFRSIFAHSPRTILLEREYILRIYDDIQRKLFEQL